MARTDPNVTRIEETIRGFARPEGVGPPIWEFAADQGGDDAVYVRFRVAKSLQLDPKKVRQLADFSYALTTALNHLETHLFFYVWFEDAKK